MDYAYSNRSNESTRHNPTQMPPHMKCTCSDNIQFTDSTVTINPKQDLKLAGMKIFASIMLHAWRRRRDDVRRLMERVEDLKQGSMKAKNQVQVFNTLFRIEQKRNDELSCQLKSSEENINNARNSCEDLTTSVCSLQADNALMKQELENRLKDLNSLNAVLLQTKSDLFRAMSEQRRLQTSLSREQRNVQILESQKNKLVNEICLLNCTNRSLEDKYNKEFDKREVELSKAKEKIARLEEKANGVELKSRNGSECSLSEKRLHLEMEQLKQHINTLELELAETCQINFNNMMQKMYCYQKQILHIVHVCIHYLLPAIPSPKVVQLRLRI